MNKLAKNKVYSLDLLDKIRRNPIKSTLIAAALGSFFAKSNDKKTIDVMDYNQKMASNNLVKNAMEQEYNFDPNKIDQYVDETPGYKTENYGLLEGTTRPFFGNVLGGIAGSGAEFGFRRAANALNNALKVPGQYTLPAPKSPKNGIPKAKGTASRILGNLGMSLGVKGRNFARRHLSGLNSAMQAGINKLDNSPLSLNRNLNLESIGLGDFIRKNDVATGMSIGVSLGMLAGAGKEGYRAGEYLSNGNPYVAAASGLATAGVAAATNSPYLVPMTASSIAGFKQDIDDKNNIEYLKKLRRKGVKIPEENLGDSFLGMEMDPDNYLKYENRGIVHHLKSQEKKASVIDKEAGLKDIAKNVGLGMLKRIKGHTPVEAFEDSTGLARAANGMISGMGTVGSIAAQGVAQAANPANYVLNNKAVKAFTKSVAKNKGLGMDSITVPDMYVAKNASIEDAIKTAQAKEMAAKTLLKQASDIYKKTAASKIVITEDTDDDNKNTEEQKGGFFENVGRAGSLGAVAGAGLGYTVPQAFGFINPKAKAISRMAGATLGSLAGAGVGTIAGIPITAISK